MARRSTQRACVQTSLAETDLDPHFAQDGKYALMNVGLW